MIKNNVYYELFASIQVPNHEEVGYWIDLGADPHGNIIKFFDKTINRWVKLTDASSEYATPPYIGNNGNWFIENRDTGIPAAGKNPYIGDNNNWFVFVPSENKYVDTGIMAKGLSAYEIAVKHGYVGTEEEWLQFLRQPALDAAAKALEATEKANKATDNAIEATTNAEIATENAQDAADRSNEIANNPPKIVNEEWYMYDELTKEYKSTGIKAIGDEFTIVKTYVSIAAMEADYDNPEVGIGQFVMIDTGDVEDPEDSRLYLKGDTEWKFISDLSGMQGIQGLSAYQVAVQEGFVGTQAEWVQSLKQPALDAADEALDAKAQVEATEALVKEAEALRVTAEEGRVDAETTRESNEAGRKSNETARGTAETARKNAEDRRVTAETVRATAETTRNTNETTRQTQEGTRQTNEITRGTAEAERISNENTRKASETTRVNQEAARVTEENVRIANENARKTAEASRSDAEDIRDANEVDRQANEAVRETQEASRQTNTSNAITAVNAAKTATEAATTNAITAAINANAKADIAFDAALHPPIIENGTWWVYKVSGETGETREYVDTGVNATGDPGKSPIIQNSTWWTYNNETGKYENTGIPIYNITKAQVEGVLTGDITTHHHDNRYYSKDNSYSKVEVDEALSAKVNSSLLGSQDGVAQLDSTGKVPAAQLPSYVDDVLEYNTLSHFPAIGESGKIYIAIDTNLTYRWSGTGYVKVASDLALGETSATAYPGDKGKASADKLSTIESNAQVNKIEAVSARGNDLAINNKRVIVPEDIAISATEPTGDELIWINTAEDYTFNFDGYTQADADAKFVAKEVGKGLSENDYTTEDKLKVANSASKADFNLELISAYWFELDDNTATTVLNTGGNRDVLENLKRKFKRGLARSYGDNGAAFSPFKDNAYTWPDGSAIEVATGGVMHHMTYFPKYYHKTVEVSSNVWRTYISEIQIDDDYIEEPERLVATYESNVDSGKLTSQPGVVSQASQTLATFVSQAKANGNKWGIQDYRIHSTIARMFCAYYANTDISTNNASIPCSGGTKNYNTDLNGGTKDLGNSDGKANTPNNEGRVSSNFLGLEDCYYGKWEFVQGVNVFDGKWVVYDGGSFPDKDVAALEAEGATNIRIAGLASTTNGYIKKVSHGRYGDVVPTEVGGSSTTYYTDHYWCNTGNRIFLRSGRSVDGAACGVFVAVASDASSISLPTFGSRLAFYGDITIVDHATFNRIS